MPAFTIICSAILFFTMLACRPGTQTPRPNILLILTDDQGWGDMSSHNNPALKTPNMDALARSGAEFDRFYVSPVCAPTRASLLTGKYFLSTGVSGVTGGREVMRSSEITLAEILKQNGYRTACFGKWHNGAHYPHTPQAQGFDEFAGFMAGHWNNYFNTTLNFNGHEQIAPGYIADILTDQTIEFIRRNKEQPFFAYLAYNTPHSPFQTPDRYFDKYKKLGLDNKLACVYGMCENLDDNLGRLLKTLKDEYLEENTIILFIGDNGPNTDRYNGNMRGRKASTHEGGMRVPGIIVWQNHIAADLRIDRIAAHIDILPTLLDLLHIEPDHRVDGKSLRPLLFKEQPDWPDREIFQHWAGKGAIRDDRYRYVRNLDGSDELYDMIDDPSEIVNLGKALPELLLRKRNAYDSWYKQVTDKGVNPPAIPIGYLQAPVTEIQCLEGILFGDLRYREGHGWANDWVVGWQDTPDSLVWQIDCVESGRFAFQLRYTASEQAIGSLVTITAAGKNLSHKLNMSFKPQIVLSPDRVPRKEIFEQTWGVLSLGELSLPFGRYPMKLSVKSAAPNNGIEIKSLIITRKE